MKEKNPQYVINSLVNQIANKALHVANLESVIAEQHNKIKDLEKDVENLRDELAKAE